MSTRTRVWRRSTHLFLFVLLLAAVASSISRAAGTIITPAVPVLLYPSNGIINSSVFPAFWWNTVPGATAYSIQISRNLAFTDLVVSADGITVDDTEAYPYYFFNTALGLNTRYYWRARAVNGTSIGAWSAARSFTTTAVDYTAPAPPTQLTPTNQATAVSSPPLLTWNASAKATWYTLQYTMDSTFQSGITTVDRLSVTSYTLKSLTPSRVYYWRVRGMTSVATGGWSSIWSFTAPAVSPTAPLLYTPKNGETNVTLTPNLTWAEATGAQGYWVQVATEPTFTIRVFDKAVATRAVQLNALQPNTTYYWRVQGFTTVQGAWSATWSFHTGYQLPAMPAIPTLASPLNGTLGASANPLLTWHTSNGAIAYTLQLAENETFGAGVVTYASLLSPSLSVTGLRANTCYYWRVNATNAAGTTVWSPIWHFTTQATLGTVPGTPTQLSPNDLTSNMPTNPRLYWSTVKTTDTYTIQLARNAAFTDRCITQSTTGTTIQFSGLLGNTRYFWRVQAVNTAGAGNWSTTRSFATQTPYGYTPATPTLLTPTNGALNQPSSVSLTWSLADRATSYNVQLALNSGFTSGLISRTQVLDTRLNVSGLASGKRYYWRIQSVNGAGNSAWSATGNFTTSTTTQLTPLK